jgi:hypothetical protein
MLKIFYLLAHMYLIKNRNAASITCWMIFMNKRLLEISSSTFDEILSLGKTSLLRNKIVAIYAVLIWEFFYYIFALALHGKSKSFHNYRTQPNSIHGEQLTRSRFTMNDR